MTNKTDKTIKVIGFISSANKIEDILCLATPSENRLSMISPIEAPVFESILKPDLDPLASTSSAVRRFFSRELQ